jgi:hypothetical protein
MVDPDDRSVTDALLDALVYAPIGFVLDARDVQPDLARRGRQHAAAARQVGELAVRAGLKRLDGAARPTDGSAAAADPAPTTDPATEVDEPLSQASASADELAIPDYDLLAASQVVKRLDALSAEELEAVRSYEASSRDRRTILHKIARLQG